MIANFAVDSFHGSRPDGLRVTYEPIQTRGGGPGPAEGGSTVADEIKGRRRVENHHHRHLAVKYVCTISNLNISGRIHFSRF